MTTHIALLRAINVGGNQKVAMSDLRGLLSDLRFEGVQSLLQTGNLVFHGRSTTSADLERLLETEAGRRLGLTTTFIVRTAKEWGAIVGRNAFPDEAERNPAHLVVLLLKDAPQPGAVKALQAAVKGPEIIRSGGKQLYIVYPAGIGRSALTNKLLEDKLGTRVTGRNWNTVLKLAALAAT